MKTYELTYIISSHISSEEVDKTKNNTEAFIQSHEGVIVKSEKSNAQTLAYPIKKQSSGYFVISEFQVNEDKIKAIKETLEKDSNILRNFILIKKPVKEMKERRTRRPLQNVELTGKERAILSDNDKKRGEKVNEGDLEKKLDEILGE